MTNLKFIKTLTAGVALATAFYPQAWADCPEGYTSELVNGQCAPIQGNACEDNKCTYYYDPSTHDMIIKPNPGAEGEIKTNILLAWDRNIRNLTIAEGITGLGMYATSNGAVNDNKGVGIGTLTLSSTLTDGLDYAMYNSHFAVVDISEIRVPIYSGNTWSGYGVAVPNMQTLIVSDKGSPFIIKGAGGYGINPPANVTIQCKGEIKECRKLLVDNNYTQTEFIYYSGLDKDGNYVEYSDDGLAVWADSTKTKPLGKYDFDGNQTASYKYDGAGNLTAAYENGVSTYKRTSYTPAEAAAAVKKGNHNKVTFTFK